MTLSLIKVAPKSYLTSKIPGEAKIAFEFGSAKIILEEGDASMITERLRGGNDELPIQGEQGWVLSFKFTPLGLYLEVEEDGVKNGKWTPGKMFFTQSKADKVADQMDGVLFDYDALNGPEFIIDGASLTH